MITRVERAKSRHRSRRQLPSLLLALAYAGAMAAAFATNSALYGFGSLALFAVLLGLLAGRSWALLAPVIVVPLLNGAFNSDSDVGGFWPTAAIGLTILAPIALFFALVGSGVRLLVDRRRRARATTLGT